MNTFQALEWCALHPFKRQVSNSIKPMYYDSNKKIFYLDNGNFEPLQVVLSNEYMFDFCHEWTAQIEKVPLSDIFDKWCDGEQVCCEINGEKWETLANKPEIFRLAGVELYRYISPSLAKQPIWWVKE